MSPGRSRQAWALECLEVGQGSSYLDWQSQGTFGGQWAGTSCSFPIQVPSTSLHGRFYPLGVAHPPWIEVVSQEKEGLNPDAPHFHFAMGPGWASLVPYLIWGPVKGSSSPEHGPFIAMAEALEPKPNCTSPFQAFAHICPLK